MASDPRKKRLKLLPEVLPAPPVASELSPRQRTLNNLSRLVAVATAAAVISGCDDHGSGYGVVDPMPPPTRCTGLAQTTHAELTWKTATTVLLNLGKPGLTGSHFGTGAPRVTVGKLVSSNITPDAAELELEAPTDGRDIVVLIEVECPAGRQLLAAVVHVVPNDASGDAGSAGTVRLSDQPL